MNEGKKEEVNEGGREEWRKTLNTSFSFLKPIFSSRGYTNAQRIPIYTFTVVPLKQYSMMTEVRD